MLSDLHMAVSRACSAPADPAQPYHSRLEQGGAAAALQALEMDTTSAVVPAPKSAFRVERSGVAILRSPRLDGASAALFLVQRFSSLMRGCPVQALAACKLLTPNTSSKHSPKMDSASAISPSLTVSGGRNLTALTRTCSTSHFCKLGIQHHAACCPRNESAQHCCAHACSDHSAHGRHTGAQQLDASLGAAMLRLLTHRSTFWALHPRQHPRYL